VSDERPDQGVDAPEGRAKGSLQVVLVVMGRCLLGLALTAVLAAVLMAATLALLWRHDGLQAWALSEALPHLPGVRVTGAQGNVWGDFRANHVEVDLPRGGMVRLEDVAWRGLRLQWAPQAGWRLGVAVASLQARQMAVRWVPNPKAQPGPPEDVASPVAVQIDRLQVAEAHGPWWGDEPLRAVDARVVVQGLQPEPVVLASPGAAGQVSHAVQLHKLSWQGWAVQGQLQLAVDHGLALHAALSAQGQVGGIAGQGRAPAPSGASGVPGGPRASSAVVPMVQQPLWAQAQAEGQLNDLQAALTVAAHPLGQATSSKAHPVQDGAMGLQADAHLQPFASWPVLKLKVAAQNLDVASLWPAGPHTSLTGSVQVRPDGSQTLGASWQFRNALAGAWNLSRLPVSQTSGQMQWPQAFDQGHLRAQPWLQGTLDAQVRGPGATEAAGQLRAQGGWGGQQALQLSWQQLWLPAWDQRAPPLRLVSGNWRLAPDWQLGGAGPSAAALPPPNKGVATVVPSGRWALQAQGEVVTLPAPGRQPSPVDGPPAGVARKPVAVEGQGDWAWSGMGGTLHVIKLSLEAANARALLQPARLSWTPAGLQALDGQLQLQTFDPAVWLPWPAGMNGRNALSGEAAFHLNAQAEGDVKLLLQPSLLGGVPLQGQASWQTHAMAANGHAETQLGMQLDAAGNTLALQTRWPRVPGQPAWPHEPRAWAGLLAQIQVHAPVLASLQPVVPLLRLKALQGAIHLQGQLAGSWPDLATSGEWRAEGLQLQAQQGPPLRIAQAQGQWQWDGRHPGSPASVHAELNRAELMGWQIPLVQADLQGLLRDHQVKLLAQATVPGKGKWAGQTLSLQAQGQGAWQVGGVLAVPAALKVTDALGAVQAAWQGQLQTFQLSRMGAATPVVAAAETLLTLAPTQLRWTREASGSTWRLSPTALTCLGVDLRLDDFIWRQPVHPGAMGDQLQAAAHLVPLDVARVLQHLQPDAGWGGNLTMDGEFKLGRDAQGAWRVAADLGRQSGDLSLREPTIQGSQAQALGIRETLIQLRAEQGNWRFTQRFDGALLGRFEFEQAVHTASPADLPGPQDKLQGKLLLTAPNLRPWGTWMPAGWRLTGEAQARADLGGTLGAPTYIGQVDARHLGLTQALMGVQLREGELSVQLAGDKLTLQRFQALSGDATHPGTVSATGEAQLLSPAQATLRLHAERFALLQRVDRRLIVSGDAQLQLTQDSIGVDGSVSVDEGLFDISRSDAPTVGDDVNVLSAEGSGGDEVSNTVTSGRKTRVKLDIDLGQRLRIQGRGLEATLTGKLKAGMVANKPTVNGTVAVEKGRYAAYGQKLVVERSTVVFNGPADNPRLDILAMRPMTGTATDSDVKVGVSITGTAQDPRIRLYSDPELSETEKLSWLVLGRAPSGLGTADIGLLQSAAVALLSGEGQSSTGNLIGALGLDELSVHQSDGTVKETVVNVGKQVSKFWYVGYERNLNATSGSWQLVYRLAQRFMVRLQAGEANALDFIWSWRWD
jgi:translocation and assembly module TamB